MPVAAIEVDQEVQAFLLMEGVGDPENLGVIFPGLDPEARGIPLIGDIGILVETPERTGLDLPDIFPGLPNPALQSGLVAVRKGLEDSLLSNLDANLELGLEGKGEDEEVKVPKREDYGSEKEYNKAYIQYLREHTDVPEEVIQSSYRGLTLPKWWKRSGVA